ncbi:MAG: hypothetical protein ACR2MP_26895 [Streptosporangiaceae bacterium]
MRLASFIRDMPARVTAGAFILNSGLSKLSADEQTATGLHQMATGAYPFLGKMKPQDFARLLAVGEVAVGSALLLPVVPSGVAGALLTGFSGGLLGLYIKIPGMRQEGSLRPTQQGIPLAKDVWLLGIGASLLLSDLTERISSSSQE